MDSGPTSHSYISQRMRLNYVDWGNSEAPPLLLVHGARDHCRSWDWLAQELRKDFHIICPDLRGHGDSEWSKDGNYEIQNFVFDIAQLIHQTNLAPLNIIAHSLGGNACLRYAGVFPQNIAKICSIEGLGPTPKLHEERILEPVTSRWRNWISDKRNSASRTLKKYKTLEEARQRMAAENPNLNQERINHLTDYGVFQNEDGTYSWKFDNHLNVMLPYDYSIDDMKVFWGEITAPTLLCYGKDSWAVSPLLDGRISMFNHAKVVEFENSGHWVHHDQFEKFTAEVKQFLGV